MGTTPGMTFTEDLSGFTLFPFSPPTPGSFPTPPPPIITQGLDPFVGIGDVTFDVVDNPGISVATGTFDSMSINANYQVMALYDFTPATVPEPSLLLVTAALFGLMVMTRKRRHCADQPRSDLAL
jgi:hypothetical protein